MPHLDILIERLKRFDEVSLLELLDITSEEIIERFMDVISARREYLFGEVEELTEEWMDEDDIIEDEYADGYQIDEGEE